MKHMLGTTLAVASLLVLSSAVAQTQSGTASAARRNAAAKPIPRTPDGKPDMQGNWTNQTFTPLERPA